MSNPYLILLSDPPWAGPVAHRLSGSDQIMGLGQKLDRDPGEFEFELRVDSKAPDPLSFPPLDWIDPVDGQLLLSRKMIDTLKSLGVGNFDMYSARVRYQPTGQMHDYVVTNVIGLASVLDASGSNESDLSGFMLGASSIRLDPEKCRGFEFARMEEIPSLIVVSPRVADGLRDSRLAGFKLIEDKEWQPGMF